MKHFHERIADNSSSHSCILDITLIFGEIITLSFQIGLSYNTVDMHENFFYHELRHYQRVFHLLIKFQYRFEQGTEFQNKY